jgi:long-chain acyl-CoA synthetase
MSGIQARTVGELPFLAAAAYSDQPAQRHHDGERWRDRSFSELRDAVLEVALGFVWLGVQHGDRVCLVSSTRPEWTFVDLGAIAAGAVVVPVYPSSSADEVLWVAGHSGSRVLVCEDAQVLSQLLPLLPQLPDVVSVVVVDPGSEEVDGVVTLDQLRTRGRSGDPVEIELRLSAVEPDDPCTIVYTSGTTGRPKGCVLTHANLQASCDVVAGIPLVGPADVVYVHLPLAHVYARVGQLACLRLGTTLAYATGDQHRLLVELAEVGATYLASVPRLFEKVYAAATAQLWESGDVAAAHATLRTLLGGQLRGAGTGAAPIAMEVLEFFHSAGIPLLEGYGMTETTAITTTQTVGEHRLGTVGRAARGVELRLAVDGEILVHGPNVFAGYYRDELATEEVLVDGWLRTGDLGAIDEDGYLRITGRSKDIIITSGGKNLAPAALENLIRQSPLVSQVVMYGDRRPYAVALLTLDPDVVRGLDPAQVPGMVQAVVDAANACFAPVEQIKRFHVLDRELSQASGELTPTLKVKRSVVHAHYAEVFEALYSEGTP